MALLVRLGRVRAIGSRGVAACEVPAGICRYFTQNLQLQGRRAGVKDGVAVRLAALKRLPKQTHRHFRDPARQIPTNGDFTPS
ncbi:hypothetical protein [Xanthomonas arboricola]|uniref:hypothetical protein n=1 Tax=Xanthomonas arboricola TaxID=56448 RepID=UPI0015E32C8D|nr:hypothetical protein [Xanthomonas arboricola]